MVIARKIAYNVIVSGVSKVFSTILALVAIGFITRYLGAEGFGNYAIVLAFLSFFAAISDLGLYQIVTREISREGADEQKIIGNVLSIRILASLAIVFLSPLVVWFFAYPLEVKRGIMIIAASFLFSSTYQALNGVFQKNLAMDKVAVSELLGKVIQVAAVVLAVKLGLGFNWIIGSVLLNMLASAILIYMFVRKYVKIRLRFDFQYWKVFLKKSMPMGVAALVAFIYFKMDTILLSVLKGSAEVGIYNAAYKVLENITFFPAMIAGLVMPIMAHSIFTDKKRFTDVSNNTFKVFFVLTVPLLIGTLFLADNIIQLIGGAGFAEAGAVLRVLVFALVLIFFGQFFNTILIVANLQKRLMWVLSLAAVVNVSLNMILIPKFSYMGSAYVSVATELVVVFLTAYIVIKKVNYRPVTEKFLRIIGAGGLMALFLFFFKELNFFILALASVLIYFLFLWLFKAIETEEITSIISKKGAQEYEKIS